MIASDQAIDFIIEALHGANAIAFDYYAGKGIEYPLPEAEALVNRIAELAENTL